MFFFFISVEASAHTPHFPVTLSVQLVFEVLLLQNLNSQPPAHPPQLTVTVDTFPGPPRSQPDTRGRPLLWFKTVAHRWPCLLLSSSPAQLWLWFGSTWGNAPTPALINPANNERSRAQTRLFVNLLLSVRWVFFALFFFLHQQMFRDLASTLTSSVSECLLHLACFSDTGLRIEAIRTFLLLTFDDSWCLMIHVLRMNVTTVWQTASPWLWCSDFFLYIASGHGASKYINILFMCT